MSLMTMIGPVDPNANRTVAQSLATRHAAAASSSTSAANATTAADDGISSSDFLTLLVTEMKNQDPTQPTDPNAYIQQLVGVNSLQQLISINQDLSSIGTTAPVTATGGVAAPTTIGS